MQILQEIFSYLSGHDLPEGFYSAEDADSEGVEGKFYIWSVDEIKKVLGELEGEILCPYNITAEGNFKGKNIPSLITEASDLEFANTENLNNDYISICREKLYKFRKQGSSL